MTLLRNRIFCGVAACFSLTACAECVLNFLFLVSHKTNFEFMVELITSTAPDATIDEIEEKML